MLGLTAQLELQRRIRSMGTRRSLCAGSDIVPAQEQRCYVRYGAARSSDTLSREATVNGASKGSARVKWSWACQMLGDAETQATTNAWVTALSPAHLWRFDGRDVATSVRSQVWQKVLMKLPLPENRTPWAGLLRSHSSTEGRGIEKYSTVICPRSMCARLCAQAAEPEHLYMALVPTNCGACWRCASMAQLQVAGCGLL